jgi:glycosyltransferase involved in cell wall biosynthesis
MRNQKPIKILLEMRPALEGYAGIPQETRLLFRGLRMLGGFTVEGMIQTSLRVLAKGTSEHGAFFLTEKRMKESLRINRYSRVIISAIERPYTTLFDRIIDFTQRRLLSTTLLIGTVLGTTTVRLSNFRVKYFEDFIWRTLFAKTLPASDRELVTGSNQRICSVPWHVMHMVGLASLNLFLKPKYPKLDTKNIDIFIGQTPYPGRPHRTTAFIVRYHDALPMFMPHTIPDKSLHQATHFYALMSNVKSGAYFACVSEATRKNLLYLFPEAESRAIVIHNMVSHHYYPAAVARELVPGIIRARLHENAKEFGLTPTFLTLREQESFYRNHLNLQKLKYLIIVSTVEPRKNHSRLLAAWEVLKAKIDPDIKLVIVGSLGWDYTFLIKNLKSWIDRGEVFMLNAVPAPDLRVLYQHATATVCPSLGEGFDFSGIEAMRSGGVVIASDIPVHREVYDDAAEYFDPYSTTNLVEALTKVIYAADAPERQRQFRERGQAVASRYLPDKVLPKWKLFLEWVAQQKQSKNFHVFTQPPSIPENLRSKLVTSVTTIEQL